MNVHARGFGIGIVGFAIGGLLAATPVGAAPSKPTGTKVAVRHSPHGKVLVGASGKFVYVHMKAGKNVGCAGLCQAIWPSVTTTGKPRAGHGVKAKQLGETSSHQVTYHGHPLFYFSPSPHAPSGDGANSFGGTWLLITAKGKLK